MNLVRSSNADFRASERYLGAMVKTANPSLEGSFQVVRNAKTGQFVTVRGVGALKGKFALRKGVDLTQPIAAQASKGPKSSAAHKR